MKTADNRYHIVYVGTDGFVHDDFEDPTTRAFTDQIPVGSLTQHIVYVDQEGSLHNDGFDPTTGTWFDQIPPRSVKAAGNSISAVDESNGHF